LNPPEPPLKPPQAPRHGELAGGVLILSLLVALFHGGSLAGGFVYDDHWTIEDNAFLREPAGVLRLLGRDLARAGVPDAGRPTLLATELVDHALWGDHPAGYHLQSVLWHLAVVLLFFAATARLTGNGPLAFIAAGLFAVHPLGVEAVAAINYREDLLAAFFTLAALCARGWPSALLIFAGVLAKENAAVAPILLVIVAPRVQARHVLPLVVGVAAAVAWRTWAVGQAGVVSLTAEIPAQHHSWLYALPTAALSLVKGAGQLLVPIGLSPEYDDPRSRWAGWVALAGLVAAVGLALRRRRHWVAVGVLAGIAAYLPTMGFVPISNLRADRYLYLPSLGFLLALAAVAAPLLERVGGTVLEVPRGWLALAVLLGVLGLRTLRQERVWRNDLALWTRATAMAPRSPRAWNALGEARLRTGATGPALEAVQHSLALAEDSQTRELLGLIQMERGDLRAARGTLEIALGAAPQQQRAELLNNLGLCELRLDDLDAALAHFAEARRRDPGYERPWLNAAQALDRAGRAEESLALLRALVAPGGNPRSSAGWAALGAALEARGQRSEALSAYQRARALGTGDPLVIAAIERLR
jgi:Flp pilus assembly protein TadD